MPGPEPSAEAFVERLPIALFRNTPEGRVVWANRACVELLGYDSFEELSRVNVEDVYVRPGERAEVVARLDSGERIPATDRLIRRADGSTFWARITVSPVTGEDGMGYYEGVAEDVTDRHDAVAAVQASERLMSSAFDDAPQGLLITGADGRPRKVNRSLLEMLGVAEPSDVEPGDLAPIVPADPDTESYRVVRKLERRDGTSLWALIAGSALHDAGGAPEGLIAQVFDISDLKHAQAELAISEGRFRAAFEHAPQGVYVLSRKGRILQANQALCDIFGLTAREMRRTDPATLLHPDDVREHMELLSSLAAGHTDTYRAEGRAWRKDGEAIYLLTAVSALRGGDGTFEGVIGQVFDVTESRRAQRLLAESEARFRGAFENAPIGMVIRRADLSPVRANSAMLRIVGKTEEQFIATPVADLGHPDDVAAVLAKVEDLRAGRADTFTMETRQRHRDGHFVWTMVAISALRGGDGQITSYLTQSVDLTDRKRSEQQMADLIRSKDELIASVSHELRTPLTSVVGFASELDERTEDFSVPESRQIVRLIAQQALEMSDLINDLLVAAKGGADRITLDRAIVDVAAEIEAVLSGWSGGATLDAPLDPVKAWVDPFRLRQIIRNLLTNAAKYGTPPITIEVEESSGRRFVRVCDQGPGLPEDQWEAIFERYYRGHDPAGLPASVGLGLTLSRDLARLQGGDLTYRAEGGRSVFELSLTGSAG